SPVLTHTDQSNELAPLHVEHGGLPPRCLLAPRPVRSVGLPHAQTASQRRLGPWGRPGIVLKSIQPNQDSTWQAALRPWRIGPVRAATALRHSAVKSGQRGAVSATR